MLDKTKEELIKELEEAKKRIEVLEKDRVLELIWPDFRIGFALCPNDADSHWFYADKRDGSIKADSGFLKDEKIELLLEKLFEKLIRKIV